MYIIVIEDASIYRISYLWYTLVGVTLAIFVGLIVSFLTTLQNSSEVDPKLLAPFIRKFIKSRKYTQKSKDSIGPCTQNPESRKGVTQVRL
nr:unnamed protein product [Callosobruchus chinensis]